MFNYPCYSSCVLGNDLLKSKHLEGLNILLSVQEAETVQNFCAQNSCKLTPSGPIYMAG